MFVCSSQLVQFWSSEILRNLFGFVVFYVWFFGYKIERFLTVFSFCDVRYSTLVAYIGLMRDKTKKRPSGNII